jgi:hypothetical protein
MFFRESFPQARVSQHAGYFFAMVMVSGKFYNSNSHQPSSNGFASMCKPYCWAFLALTIGAPATQAQTELRWHFKEGETFWVERVQTRKQTVDIKTKSFVEQHDKTWVTAVTVKEKTQAGFVLDLKIVSMQVGPTGKTHAAGMPMLGGLDASLAQKVIGCRFTATITPLGKVIKFEGYGAFLQRLAGKNEESAKTLKVLVSEETLREEVEDLFNFLPEKAVSKGDQWKREATEPMPPFGFIKAVYEYVLEENDGKEVGINFKVKMSYKPPNGDGDLFRVLKGSLQTDEGKGTLVLDGKKGWLVRSEKTVRFRGDLTIETMNKQTSLAFASAISIRVRWLAKFDRIED